MAVAIALSVGIGVLALAIGALLGYSLKVRVGRGQVLTAQRDVQRMRADAEAQQKEILLEAKEEAIRIRSQVQAEVKERRDEISGLERRIASKEENLDRKLEALERREGALSSREQEVENSRAELERLHQQEIQEIERVSRLSSEEARELLLQAVEKETRDDANRRLRQIEAELKEEADARARSVLGTVMQRLATDVVHESAVSVVPIPSDDMKTTLDRSITTFPPTRSAILFSSEPACLA